MAEEVAYPSPESLGIAWVAHMRFGSKVFFGVGLSKYEADEDLGAAVWLAIQALRARGEPLPSPGRVLFEMVPNIVTTGTGISSLDNPEKSAWIGFRPVVAPYQC